MTREMRQGRGSRWGCGTWLAIGCLALILLCVGSAVALSVVDRMWFRPEPLPAVNTEGDCPSSEVAAFLDGSDARLASFFGALEDLDTGAAGGEPNSVENLDVPAMRAELAEARELDVPPCARQTLVAEIELAEFVVGTIEDVQECPQERSLCSVRALWTLARGVAPHVDRVERAHEALAEEAELTYP